MMIIDENYNDTGNDTFDDDNCEKINRLVVLV